MFSLTQSEYEALVFFASQGASDLQRAGLEKMLLGIEKRSGIERDVVYCIWELPDEIPPANVRFPDRWPPQQRGFVMLLDRKVSRQDVEQYVKRRSPQHGVIYVTRDSAYVAGLSTLDQFFR